MKFLYGKGVIMSAIHFIVKRIKLVFREKSQIYSFSVVLFQLNSNLVSTMSNIMEADSALLVEAQRRSKACSRFVP